MMHGTRPPRLGAWLLSHFRPRGDIDVVLGDLEEEFHVHATHRGARAARRWYWGQVFRSLPRFSRDMLYWGAIMLNNYFKLALRSLHRQKGYTFINLFGLAVGLAACLVIGLFIQHKLSYDHFHADAERIYRLIRERDSGNNSAETYAGIPQTVEEQFPEVERVTVVGPFNRELFTRGEARLYVDDVLRVDDAFFDVFTFTMLQGNVATALERPNQLVLTRTLAERLFGEADPVGRSLVLDDNEAYEVSGVVADVPANSHFRFDALISLSAGQRRLRSNSEVSWSWHPGQQTYVKLRAGGSPDAFENQLAAFVATVEKLAWMQEERFDFALEPLLDIHLHSMVRDEAQSDIRYLYLFGGIGVLILLIACVNYMNLSTARSALRGREVGMRKVVGAGRGQLVLQFLGESVMFAFLASGFALGLVYLALPVLDDLTGLALSLGAVLHGRFAVALFGFTLFVGLLAGSYPALFLSAFQPVRVLKGVTPTGGRSLLRKALFTFQFASSVGLILGAVLIQLQLRYVQNERLGFDKAQVVTLQGFGLGTQYDAFKKSLLADPHVLSVTSGPPPGIGSYNGRMGLADPQTGERWEVERLAVDYDYLETFGFSPLQGRLFSRAFPGDTLGAAVVTQSVTAPLGIEDAPIGHRLYERETAPIIVGVVDDFHNSSLHTPARPVMFTLQPGLSYGGYNVHLRLAAGDVRPGLDHLAATWARFVPDRPLDFAFLDDRIEQLYQAEQRLARIFGLFSGLAILVACLGLFGLASFTAEQRTREIGIRKVLGATIGQILVLLSKDYAGLVLTGYVLAVPVVYIVMHRWLASFAYHIDVGPGVFLAVGLAMLVLALATVGYQSVRAARSNPVRALRHE